MLAIGRWADKAERLAVAAQRQSTYADPRGERTHGERMRDRGAGFTVGPEGLVVWALEGYEPLALVGHGSTGVVVSARDSATGAIVAIRYLAREVCESPDFLVRYRGEVAMLGLIEHPQVANVYELVERGGTAAVVTELIDGVSLRRILDKTGPLEPKAALYVVKGALLGLQEVHSRGIVHLAMKPENVLIDADGNVKIVDVGLTPPAHNPPNPTYAAPELWTGGQPTPASDVYAATAILFECLSGQPPHGTGGASLGRSGQTPDAAIAGIRLELAPHQTRVFMASGLAVDPQTRPLDARAALQQMDILAFTAFGPAWYDTGHTLLRRRLARVPTGLPNTPLYDRPRELAPASAAPPPSPAGAAAPTTPSYAAPPMTPRYAPPRPSSPVAAPVSPFAATAAFAGGDQRGTVAGGDQRDTITKAAAWGGTSVVVATAASTPAAAEPAAWLPLEESSHRESAKRMTRILIAAAVMVLLAAGTALAVTTAFGQRDESPTAVTTNSHQPIVVPGPTVPVPSTSGPGADTTKPARPAGLRVTGRSVSAVSINWAASVDDVGVAGYIVVRNGKRVGTTYEPGFTDSGLQTQTRYQYAVAAFDAAGNVSATSAPVTATTLKEPDVSPPSIPANLRSTGKSTTTIVLAWSASQDNIGVAGYEVYRDGTLIANVSQPGYTDNGLGAATSHTYRVRAFDTSNNASADSNAITVVTLTAPDTTPPRVPVGVTANATSSSTIDVSWAASTDNVGVTKYRVYRDGSQVTEVPDAIFTDQGLTASTSYSYTVRAVDAAGNQSGLSASASASTSAAPTTPPPTTPPATTQPPTTDPAPVVWSVDLNITSIIGCTATIEATVVATGPMDVDLDYTITGHSGGSVPFSLTTGNLSQTQVLATDVDTTESGSAFGWAGGQSDTEGWTACVTTPPTTDL